MTLSTNQTLAEIGEWRVAGVVGAVEMDGDGY
jgi:hypothetical protein